MLLAVYAIVGGNEAGWLSARTLGLLAVSLALAAAFLAIEARVAAPLVPLALLRLGGLARANAIGMLWSASMFAAFFLSALYLQLVLGYTPLQIGLAFLPTNILMAAFSLGLSARIVMRWGNRGPIVAGLAMITLGLALLARAPTDATFAVDVLPAFVLQGLGAAVALNPLLMAAMGWSARRIPASPRGWSTPPSCSAGRWGSPSWRASPRRGRRRWAPPASRPPRR